MPTQWQPTGGVVTLVEQLEAQREDLVAAMRRVVPAPPGVPEEQSVQFYVGYVDLIVASAKGDAGPRDTYLNAVIPGVKAAGMPLPFILGTLAGCNAALAATMGPAHLPWVAAFCTAYSEDLVTVWARS